MSQTLVKSTSLHIPGTHYCEYVTRKCIEKIPNPNQQKVLFLYPREPFVLASTIEAAADALGKKNSGISYITWRDIRTEGKVIFCEICKTMVASSLIVCDITNLNFNVMFEIGYLCGLSKPFIPIFDTTFGTDKNLLNKIGLLDVLGYKEYLNTQQIISIVEKGAPPIPFQRHSNIDRFKPIYYVKPPVEIEGNIRIGSILKKSPFGFRTFDSVEQPRLSVLNAIEEVDKSLAVLLHLLMADRGEHATIHNARSAFVAGLAVASQRKVLILQEGLSDYPIDYRDIIRPYQDHSAISPVMQDFLKGVGLMIQSPAEKVSMTKRSELEDIDIGHIAAENEEENLRSYYLRTGQYNEVRQGHAQLVVGRRGSGKTALFYAVREHVGPDRNDTLVLDLKPEGYQLAKLNECILSKMSTAVKEHTLAAIWEYILLLEIAHKILSDRKENNLAYKDTNILRRMEKIRAEYSQHRGIDEGDFSERMNSLIDQIISRWPAIDISKGAPAITQLIFNQDIFNLKNHLIEYLKQKEEVWLLIDNLDKNWKVGMESEYGVAILQALLIACKKLQRVISKESVNFHSVIFIRNDIYSYFLQKTTDRGKEHVLYLNWDDRELFKEIFRLRVTSTKRSENTAEEMWSTVFDLHVAGESSFNYILDRTMMRPRDFLIFLQHCIRTAINRGRNRVSSDDILHAEKLYSRDLKLSLEHEILDINPKFENVLYMFLNASRSMFESEARVLLVKSGVHENEVDQLLELLIWLGFIGVSTTDLAEERYAYNEGHDVKKLMRIGGEADRVLVIHPGFTSVLELKN